MCYQPFEDNKWNLFQSCPTSYTFDNCAAEVGSDDCGFVEDPADNLDWVIAKGNFVSHIYFNLDLSKSVFIFLFVGCLGRRRTSSRAMNELYI